MRKLKVIQIGIGHDHARDILNCMLTLPDIFDVKALSVLPDEEEEFCEDIRRYSEMGVKLLPCGEALSLPDLDAAIIETREKNLTEYALLAAKKGLHIHMDKPGGFDDNKFCELVNYLKEHNLVFSVGYMYRFNPYIKEAIKIAKSGELGKIYSVEAHMSCEHSQKKREWMGSLPGGMMFFLGCHLIDLVYTIQGEPQEVIPLNASINGSTTDFGMAAYRYPHGTSFVKATSAEPGGFLRRQLVICGEKGTVVVNPLEEYADKIDGQADMFSKMRITRTSSNGLDKGICTKSEPFKRYAAMMQNFCDMVINDKANQYSYEYELELYKLLLRSCEVTQ